MPEPIIELKNLTKTYWRDKVQITPLESINLVIEKNEFLALMGPSGSGKTTLLNLVAGIDSPTSGTVRVNGVNLEELSDNELSRWRNKNIGYVFQLYNLMPVLTAFENVELPLLLLPLTKSQREKQVTMALKAVGIEDRAEHYPNQLSGGQEQRVAIARAIVTDPSIIVADEPTGDLDAKSEQEILSLLKKLNEDLQKTIIMVTHDHKAAQFARRIMSLDKGVLSNKEEECKPR
jgi:putative ABC transport system ATP-binding protein